MMEEYRAIPGYEGLYAVSNFGNVKAFERIRTMPNGTVKIYMEKVMVLEQVWKGYLRAKLTVNGKNKKVYVHVLVATLFKPRTDDLSIQKEVNHKDGNKKNNHADNLEWITRSGNALHYWRVLGGHGHRKKLK
jgi:hypothetical protein